MRGDLGVRMERKPVDPGTAGARQCGVFPFRAKARTNPSYLLARPLSKGDALLHRGRQGTSECGCGIHQGVIAGRHRRVATRFEVPQRAELADDPMADRLDHRGDVGIAGRLDREKAGLEARLGAIEVDALKKEDMKMEMQEKRSTTPCRPP